METSIVIPETPQDVMTEMLHELQLLPIAAAIQSGEVDLSALPEEFSNALKSLLITLSDMFSFSPPDADSDVDQVLRKIGREIQLSRIIRERGIFRLHSFLRKLDNDGLPVFMGLRNPDDNAPFSTQEDFIGWFCRAASVSRGLVFMRLAAIERILALGFNETETFELITSRPFAMQEVARMMGTWKGNMLLDVNPQDIVRVAARVRPDMVDALEIMASTYDENKPQFLAAAKKVMAGLLMEVASHTSGKDALNFVKHDLLLAPEISYSWDTELDCLVASVQVTEVDENGTPYIASVITVPFLPDVPELPESLRADLIRRLPITNRHMLP